MICCNCGHTTFDRKHYSETPDIFREMFKVGDIIQGNGWAKYVEITAIGKYRFFAINTDVVDEIKNDRKYLNTNRVNKIEKPYTMYNPYTLFRGKNK